VRIRSAAPIRAFLAPNVKPLLRQFAQNPRFPARVASTGPATVDAPAVRAGNGLSSDSGAPTVRSKAKPRSRRARIDGEQRNVCDDRIVFPFNSVSEEEMGKGILLWLLGIPIPIIIIILLIWH
jgi:hypothetical protein